MLLGGVRLVESILGIDLCGVSMALLVDGSEEIEAKASFLYDGVYSAWISYHCLFK